MTTHHCVYELMKFWQTILETVRDRDLVPKGHQYEMANAESNGQVTDDVT